MSLLFAGIAGEQPSVEFPPTPSVSGMDASLASSWVAPVIPADTGPAPESDSSSPSQQPTSSPSAADGTSGDLADEFGGLTSSQIAALLPTQDSSPAEAGGQAADGGQSGGSSGGGSSGSSAGAAPQSPGAPPPSSPQENSPPPPSNPPPVLGPTFTWTQPTPVAPTFGTVADQTSVEGDAVSLAVPVSSPGTVTFAALNLPAGLSIDAQTGVVSGTVATEAVDVADGHYATTIVAANDQGGSATLTFDWDVTAAAPVLSNPGGQTSQRGDSVSLQLSASQAFDRPVSFDAIGLPAGLSIDGQGSISGIIAANAGQATPYAVTVTATCGGSSTSQTFDWAVSNANRAPTLASPGEQSDRAGDRVWLELSADDADGDALLWSATGLPTGLSLDQYTGFVEGTLEDSSAGPSPHQVTFSVSDGNASASQSLLWSVSPLRLVAPQEREDAAGATVSLQVEGHSATGSPLTYSATGLPTGLDVDANTGLIFGTIDLAAVSSQPYDATLSVTDGTFTDSRSIDWRVSSVLLDWIDQQSNLAGEVVSLNLVAEYYGTAPLVWSGTGLPPGLSLESSTGQVSGTIAEGIRGVFYEVTVSVVGTGGATQTFEWRVDPASNVAPQLPDPGDQSSQLGQSVFLSLSATDDDGDAMTYSAVGLPAGLEIDQDTGTISGTLAT